MIREESIKKLRAGLTPLPEHVFVDDQPWLADHLLPLLSIDLGLVRPELAGTVVHMLQPIGPIEGYIGDDTREFHNEFTAPNWFALHLTEDNRYRFLGQEEYFLPYDEEYAAGLTEYKAKVRAYAKDHGRLAEFPSDFKGMAYEHAWLDILGGEFWAGNWTTEDPPCAFEFNYEEREDNRIELNYQGKPFFPVACANGLTILMFYEPESRTILFTFDES
ncbi:enolase [Massilia sp. TWP1-3-3]|uniref:enolase n=1 Tax=Massilia sp. TWP1-3-3 TaxID=2804573 RepID=UPI003CF4382A